MDRLLELELFKKYPKIFPPNDWLEYDPKKRNSLECGDGWLNLIDCLCQEIQAYVDCKTRIPFDQPLQVEAVYIKEKFGTLRFSTINSNPNIERLINEACIASGKTCEECGSKDNVTQTTGCIMTLCSACLKTCSES